MLVRTINVPSPGFSFTWIGSVVNDMIYLSDTCTVSVTVVNS